MTSQDERTAARSVRFHQVHRPDQRCPICGSIHIVEAIYDGEAAAPADEGLLDGPIGVFTVIRPRCRCYLLTP